MIKDTGTHSSSSWKKYLDGKNENHVYFRLNLFEFNEK